MGRHDDPEKGRNRKGKKDRKDGAPRVQDREVLISKKMSLVLRHTAKQEKIKMDQRGFVNVQDLVGARFLLRMYCICLALCMGWVK